MRPAPPSYAVTPVHISMHRVKPCLGVLLFCRATHSEMRRADTASAQSLGMQGCAIAFQRRAWKEELTYILEEEGTCMGTPTSALGS